MRKKLVEALKDKFRADYSTAHASLEIYMTNPVGIGEHSDVMGSITTELDQIAKYHDQIEVIEKYFKKEIKDSDSTYEPNYYP